MTLVEQCRSSQFKVQRIVERTGDADPVLFEALNVNDDLQRVLTKFEEMSKGSPEQPQQPAPPAEPTLALVQAEEDEEEAALVRKRETTKLNASSPHTDDVAMADLDEMIFGNNRAAAEGSGKKKNADDLITF